MSKAASVFIGITGIIAASLLPALGQATSAGWSTLAPLPTARQEISVSVLDGKVFVIAGYDANGQSTATVEVYDPRSNAWQKAAPLPIATNHNAAATVNGRLYAFGGRARVRLSTLLTVTRGPRWRRCGTRTAERRR